MSQTDSSFVLLLDPTHRTLLHLHMAAHTILTQSRALSSHLASRLLSCADENDVNLPKSFIDTRLCQRCGTPYLPGITSTVRTIQSRRQKRKARQLTWVVYHCNVCNGNFKTEVDATPQEDTREAGSSSTSIQKPETIATSSNRKRKRLQGLKKEIERSKEKRGVELDLLDLMKTA